MGSSYVTWHPTTAHQNIFLFKEIENSGQSVWVEKQDGLALHISSIWLNISDLNVKVSRAVSAQWSTWRKLHVDPVEGQPGVLLLLIAQQLDAKVEVQSQSQRHSSSSPTWIDRLLSGTAYEVNPRAGPTVHRLCHINPQFRNWQSLQQRKPYAAEGSVSGAGARPLGQEEPWGPGCQP